MKCLPPIEEVLKSGIHKDHYIHLYDIPLTRLKMKYKGIKKNKYKNIRCLGAIQLTYNAKSNKFFMILQFTFRLPYYKKSIYVKMPLCQKHLQELLKIRQQLRPIVDNRTDVVSCRKLSPQTLIDDKEKAKRLRALREEKRKQLKEKKEKCQVVPTK